MKRVNRKDSYPVKYKTVLFLASGDDTFKTSSFFLKYFIAHLKMIGTSEIFSCLQIQYLNYILIEDFK